LSGSDIHALAQQKKDFEVCKLDLKSTNIAYQKCIADDHPKSAWWQSPEYAIGAPLVAVILTVLVSGLISQK